MTTNQDDIFTELNSKNAMHCHQDHCHCYLDVFSLFLFSMLMIFLQCSIATCVENLKFIQHGSFPPAWFKNSKMITISCCMLRKEFKFIQKKVNCNNGAAWPHTLFLYMLMPCFALSMPSMHGLTPIQILPSRWPCTQMIFHPFKLLMPLFAYAVMCRLKKIIKQ